MNEEKRDIIRVIISVVLLAVIYFLPLGEPWKLICYMIPYAIAGYETILEAIEGIKDGEMLDENFLMTIATIGAFAIGDYPEAVFVMVFFQVGEIFEHLAVDKSRSSISDLMNIKPEFANREINGEVTQIKPEEVAVGDTLVIMPGEKIPVDGLVIEGSSSLNTMALTGESLPRDIQTGDHIISGTVNLTGLIKIKAEKPLEESTVTKILKLVEDSSEKKTKTENFITRFARVYTPIVVIGAVLLVAIPSIITGDFSLWLNRGLIFLVVSCPCALVLSVPLAYFAAIGGASKLGILIKGANYLEVLGMTDTVVMDKTGTLTEGKFKVVAVKPSEESKISKEELINLAGALEDFSTHPIALSIKAACKGELPKRVTEVQEIAGKGISAVLNGDTYYCGNIRLMEDVDAKAKQITELGTALYLSRGNQYLGGILVADVIKEDSAQAIKDLKKSGIKNIIMLTGDRREVASQVGNELGVDKVYGQLLPSEKVSIFNEIVENAQKKVVFVGDGINDAPVLARADAGIAMGALGSDAAIEAADIVLMEDRISRIPSAIKLSRATKKIVWENIIFALAIKVIVLALGAIGIATMWEAVFADVGVTAIAILNSIRALRVDKYR